MMKRLLLATLTILSLTAGYVSPVVAVDDGQVEQKTTSANPVNMGREKDCATYRRLMTMPAWYEGLLDKSCNVEKPTGTAEGLNAFIWTIVLNIIEIALQLVGYLCAAYIIYGGFKYLSSTGSSDGMAKAKTTILNAVIGLILSMVSVGIVNVIAGALN